MHVNNYSATSLTVATQQTFFFKLANQDIFLLVHKILYKMTCFQ